MIMCHSMLLWFVPRRSISFNGSHYTYDQSRSKVDFESSILERTDKTIDTSDYSSERTQSRVSLMQYACLVISFVFSYQLDEKIIQSIALGQDRSDSSLVKRFCSYRNITDVNGTSSLIPNERCHFIFAKASWPDWTIGILLLFVSLFCLCACLVLLVKLLQSMLKGTISTVIFKTVNADFPGIFHHLTPYLAIGVKSQQHDKNFSHMSTHVSISL
jgi:hypothetical protein